MGRPKKETVDYFPHICNSGKTIFIVESNFGNDGYAFWFKLLEILATSERHFYDCRKPAAWEFLLAKTHVNDETGNKILNLLADLDAIDTDLWLTNRVLWVQNLVDNVADVYKNRKTDVPLKPSFCDQKCGTGDVSTTGNSQEAVVSTSEKPQSKLKETKLKESKVVVETTTDKEQDEKVTLTDVTVKHLHTLPAWGNSDIPGDYRWLTEFISEFPGFRISHLRGCRDFHSSKNKHSKALWKSRLRNWMKKENDGPHKQGTRGYHERVPDEYPSLKEIYES